MRTKKLVFVTFVLFMFAALAACEKEKKDDTQPDPEPQHTFDILIYGRPSCGHCTAFKQACEDNNLEYTFYDIDQNAEKKTEMWDKVNNAGLGNGGSIGLPIVDAIVDGTSNVFERPDIQTILDLKP